MLAKEFIIKDILDYELINDVNILEELTNGNFFILQDLIKLGTKCSDEEAQTLVEEYINKYGFDETFKMMAYEVIGKEPSEKDDCKDSKDYKSFSEVLEDFYNQIQSVDKNLTLSDFWNISTRYMYKYSDGLKKRYIFNLNRQSQDQFLNAETFIGLLFGKLKEPIAFDANGKRCKLGQQNMTLKDKILAVKNHQC